MQASVSQATSVLEVAKIAIPVLALVWAVMLAYRKREWFTPTIALSAGEFAAGDFSNTPKSIRAKTIGSFLYLVDFPARGHAIIALWFRVRAGRQPLRNVKLQLLFPEENFFSEDRLAQFMDVEAIRSLMRPKDRTSPEVTQTGSAEGGVATVTYATALLRPGETFSVIQPLVLDLDSGQRLSQTETPPPAPGATEQIEMPFASTPFLRRLQPARGFVDYITIRAIANSESTAARRQRIDVYTFRHKAGQDISEALEKLEIAMWNGRPPRAGEFYYNPIPWASLFKVGVIQVVNPALRPVGGSLFVQEPYGKRQVGLSTLRIPPWDYVTSDEAGFIGFRIKRAHQGRRQYKRTTLSLKRKD